MSNKRLILGALCAAFVVYTSIVYTSGTDAAHHEPMSEAARHGQRVFQANNCVACHQFYGLGGYMGPDLTNVISNRGTAYARAFIVAGTTSMPAFALQPDEVDALIEYLSFVDKTGTYPAEDYSVKWYGTVAQADDPR